MSFIFLRILKYSSPIITWSTTSKLMTLLFLTNSIVNLISAIDGVGSPEGWLWTKIKLVDDYL